MQPTVLYIDDAPSNLFLLELIAEDQGILLETASNGELGLKKTREREYDLILSDIRLPDVNGFEILKELRLQSLNVFTPVIAFTADVTRSNQRKIVEHGFTDYLSKPFKDDDLINKFKLSLAPARCEVDLSNYLKYITQQSQVEKAQSIILEDLHDFEKKFCLAWFDKNEAEIDTQLHKAAFIMGNLKLTDLQKTIEEFKLKRGSQVDQQLLLMEIKMKLLGIYRTLSDVGSWKITG